MKTLHILNGNSTAFTFERTGIEGDTLIWRELLSEGPVSVTNLWDTRLPWMKANYGVDEIEYQKMVVDEASKIKNLSAYENLVLWFEFDLVCQINLIYILHLLHEASSRPKNISLICPDHFKGIPNFRGLGQLNSSQLASLETSKVQLDSADLAFASKAWNIYSLNNPTEITAFLESDFGHLSLLKPALKAHLLRLPSPDNKLNYIEELLLKIVKSGFRGKKELYSKFWEAAPIFGMGDLQIEHYLKKLKAKKLIAK